MSMPSLQAVEGYLAVLSYTRMDIGAQRGDCGSCHHGTRSTGGASAWKVKDDEVCAPGTMPAKLWEKCALMLPLGRGCVFPGVLSSTPRASIEAP